MVFPVRSRDRSAKKSAPDFQLMAELAHPGGITHPGGSRYKRAVNFNPIKTPIGPDAPGHFHLRAAKRNRRYTPACEYPCGRESLDPVTGAGYRLGGIEEMTNKCEYFFIASLLFGRAATGNDEPVITFRIGSAKTVGDR